jgi:RNA polymerase sigma-70 factor (ECF subfamily)
MHPKDEHIPCCGFVYICRTMFFTAGLYMTSIAATYTHAPIFTYRNNLKNVLRWLLLIFAAGIHWLFKNAFPETVYVCSREHNKHDPAIDMQLVAHCKSGDKQAFEELVYRYQDIVFSLCVRLLGNHADGEDAAQETFIKAYQALQGFKGDASFSTWLFRIATNVCRNHQVSFFGKFSRKVLRLDKQVQDEDGNSSPAFEVPSHSDAPDTVLQKKQTARTIQKALAKLPAKHRELIVLADIQELSYEEIQGITALALGTIKSRLARAREAMKRFLLAGNVC